MARMLSSCSLFALLYKTAMVPSGLIKTPQSALWPIQNTTERVVAYSKHHRALCGLFETPQSALWCFILRFNIENLDGSLTRKHLTAIF
jgi:hypothetical protein